MSPVVFKVGDGYVDPNGNAVKEDGTPIHSATPATADAATLATLTQERDEARAAALPADARERLIAVKGVGDALADAILAALKD